MAAHDLAVERPRSRISTMLEDGFLSPVADPNEHSALLTDESSVNGQCIPAQIIVDEDGLSKPQKPF